MSIAIVAMVLKRRLGSTARKAVAFKLADVSDDEGGNIYPSVKTIAAEAEVSERTAQYILKEFVSEGLLIIVEARANGGYGANKTTKYKFNINKLMSFPSTKTESTINRGANAAPHISTELSTGVQIASDRGADPADSGCSPCTQSFKGNPSKNPKALSPPARRKKERVINSDFELKGRFVERAKGLGLPVPDLIATVGSETRDSPTGYFTALCIKSCKPIFPELSDDNLDSLIRGALWGADKFYQAVLTSVSERQRDKRGAPIQ